MQILKKMMTKCNQWIRCRRTQLAVALIFGLVALPAGCSKEDVTKITNTVRQQASNIATQTKEYTQTAVAKVEEVLPEGGSVKLRMDPEIEVASANAKIVDLGDGRSIVQVASYDTSSPPKLYPSLLMLGTTTAKDAATLAGQTVNCEIYVQERMGSSVLKAPTGKPVRVVFGPFDPNKSILQASISSGSLVSSENETIVLNGGRVIAKFEGK